MLNDDKVEFLLVGSRKQLAKVSIDSVSVGDCNISPSPAVRDLGTWFNRRLHIRDVNITKNCSNAFYYLYDIRHIRKYLSRSSTETLVHVALLLVDSRTTVTAYYMVHRNISCLSCSV